MHILSLSATSLFCILPLLAGVVTAEPSPTTGALGASRAARWEEAIARYEAADRENRPAPGGILFVGSSSIVGWDVNRWFPELPVVNRGFGGSYLADSYHFADRIIFPYAPKTIVLYAGDNDLAGGRSPRAVLEDYKALAARIHEHLPETRIVYVSIKLCENRRSLMSKAREANGLIAAEIETDPLAAYFDAASVLLDADGAPRPEFFREDRLHLNDEGYRVWSESLRPLLQSNATER